MWAAYAFWNPIKNVDVERGIVEYFVEPTHIDVGPHRYFAGKYIEIKAPVDALIEVGLLRKPCINEKIDRCGCDFEEFPKAVQIDDSQIIKQIIDRIELPNKDERFFIPSYKEGKGIEKYSARTKKIENCVGRLSRQQAEAVSRDISKETGKNYVVLTAQGFCDEVAKDRRMKKLLLHTWTHLLHGFVNPHDGVSAANAGVGGTDVEEIYRFRVGSERPSMNLDGPLILENLSLSH